MNEFLRAFLNCPEMDGVNLNFINRIQKNLIQNSKNTETEQAIINNNSIAEWEKLLDILRYRYSLDVRADVAKILSDFKPAKTEPNFLEVLFKIVLKVDELLEFHEYNVTMDDDSDDEDDSDEWLIPELGVLLAEMDKDSDRLFKKRIIHEWNVLLLQ